MKKLLSVIFFLVLASQAYALGGVLAGVFGGVVPCTPQAITWNTQPAAMTYGDADQTLNQASSDSALGITYTTDTTTYCTVVSGPKLHAVNASGNCVVHANQTGNETYCVATQVNSGNIAITAGAVGAPQFRSKTYTVDDDEGNTHTVTEPAGAAEGDILFWWVEINRETPTPTTPSGWTKLTELNDHAIVGTTAVLYWIRRGASAPSYDLTYTTNPIKVISSVTAWSGAASSGNPYSAWSQTATPAERNPANPNTPTLATGTTNTTVISFGVSSATLTGTWTAPSGYTLREGTGGENYSVCVASKEVATSTNEDPGAFSGAPAGAGQVVFEVTVALKP